MHPSSEKYQVFSCFIEDEAHWESYIYFFQLGCLVTKIAEEYKYFYHEVLNPAKFGFKSWPDLVNTIPELSIKPLKAHRVIVSEPLGREAATELLASAFMQVQSNEDSIIAEISRSEASTQTEPLPLVLFPKEEDTVVKAEASNSPDLYVCNQDDGIISNNRSSTEQSTTTTNTTSTGFVKSVENITPTMGTTTAETSTSKKNPSTGHFKKKSAPQPKSLPKSTKNLTSGSASDVQQPAESISILAYLIRTNAVVKAESSREKNGKSVKKEGKDDQKEPKEANKSPVKSISRAKRARSQWISRTEESPAHVETESSPPVIYIGSSKRLKASTDDGCSTDGDVGSRGGRSRKRTGATGKRKQTAQKT